MNKQIEVAVKWWCDVLRNAKQDNGDAMTSVMARLIKIDVSTEQLEVFGNAFKSLLSDFLANNGWEENNPHCVAIRCIVGCDYAPDLILRNAAEVAGIKPSCPPFPMKTIMWISSDKVRVQYGYGAEVQVLWDSKNETSK